MSMRTGFVFDGFGISIFRHWNNLFYKKKNVVITAQVLAPINKILKAALGKFEETKDATKSKQIKLLHINENVEVLVSHFSSKLDDILRSEGENLKILFRSKYFCYKIESNFVLCNSFTDSHRFFKPQIRVSNFLLTLATSTNMKVMTKMVTSLDFSSLVAHTEALAVKHNNIDTDKRAKIVQLATLTFRLIRMLHDNDKTNVTSRSF